MPLSCRDGPFQPVRYAQSFTLRYAGGRWLAACEAFTVAAAGLGELDRLVERELGRRGLLAAEGPTRVRMSFDRRGLPEWIRQYSSHYFDRVVVFGQDGR